MDEGSFGFLPRDLVLVRFWLSGFAFVALDVVAITSKNMDLKEERTEKKLRKRKRNVYIKETKRNLLEEN